jgi:hypothetical protein
MFMCHVGAGIRLAHQQHKMHCNQEDGGAWAWHMKASTHTGSTDCIYHAFSTNLVKVMKSTLLFGCCCHLRPNIRGALCSFCWFSCVQGAAGSSSPSFVCTVCQKSAENGVQEAGVDCGTCTGWWWTNIVKQLLL